MVSHWYKQITDMLLLNVMLLIQVSLSMRLPPYFTEHAHRLYSLALDKKFVYGRRQMHIVATVLYIICRQEKSPHLLIDFSDALQVNVYTIGKTFLQLCRILNLKMPVVDPCLYIHRFVTRLDLGEKMGNISTTALRIVTRMKKDWINTGRRPDGVCSAALLIACRSYGVSKSISEIAGLFRITEATLKRRLIDFQNTPSSQLTVEQFHQQDFNFELDPPTYIHSRQLEAGRKKQQLVYNLHGNAQRAEEGDVDDDDEVETNDVDFINVTVADDGQRSQVLKFGDIEIYTRLPPAINSDSDGDSNTGTETENNVTGIFDGQSRKRKAVSAKGLEKDMRRRELYGQIYSDIGDAVEEQIQSTKSLPYTLPNEHLQIQADMLFKEAQEVGKKKNVAGGWNAKTRTRSNVQLYKPVHSQSVPAGESSANKSGSNVEIYNTNVDSAESGNEAEPNDANDEEDDDFVMSDSELESFILTTEEREKRSALWERMHRPFLDEQERKRQARLASSSTTKSNVASSGQKYKSTLGSRNNVLPEGKFSLGDRSVPSTSNVVVKASTAANRRGRKSSSNINYDAMSGIDALKDSGIDQFSVKNEASLSDSTNRVGGRGGQTGKKIIVGATVGGTELQSKGSNVGGKNISFPPHLESNAASSSLSTSGPVIGGVVTSILTEEGDGDNTYDEEYDEEDELVYEDDHRNAGNDDYEQDDDYHYN